ncbi:response regulator [Lysobacter sp. LF1]|uniref:Response regulator n=1 Tax=Lysobacter stagni TaxID=3045172 RepID=A0ABT6XEK1_9GAMM|nr:response regulator [Lysobacter sp. LF1]MDI9238577.1 response regulator [Lysobacter sp. LF1]
MNPTVYLVDDDPGVLTAVTRLLTSDGLATCPCSTTRAFLDAYDASMAGCVVLDLSMPGMNGLELQALLRERGVGCPVIFLSGCGDIPTSVRAMKAGAIDFLTKPVDGATLLDAVRRGISLDEEVRRSRVDQHDAQALLDTLTPREREVVPYLLAARLNKQIAADLGVAEKTVKVHRSRILHKLGVRSLVDLVHFMERVERQAGTPPSWGPPASPTPRFASNAR